MTASDDVIAAHKPGPNVLVHRPKSGAEIGPACAAANNDGEWQRFGAWLARKENASLCRECYPKGWAE